MATRKRITLVIVLTLLCLPRSTALPKSASRSVLSRASEWMVVWNVGQGLWVTIVSAHACWHFDMGGEKRHFASISRSVEKLCFKKQNPVVISHADADHVRWVNKMARRLASLCIFRAPLEPLTTRQKKYLAGVPACGPAVKGPIEEVTVRPQSPQSSSNERSRAFVYANKVLLPGDAPAEREKHWNSKSLSKVEILVLGHHGSRTSTSHSLLKKLTGLRLTIASSRQAMYGHPHPDIIKKLRQYKLPLLHTETWGSLAFEIVPSLINQKELGH